MGLHPYPCRNLFVERYGVVGLEGLEVAQSNRAIHPNYTARKSSKN